MVAVDRWTTADLERFPDADDLRYEIINGELHVTKAPNSYHQVVAGRIAAALDTWSIASGNGLAIAAPGIILEDDDNIIPDAVWISAERLATALRSDGKLYALPELVVEVLSPGTANVQRDREDKPAVYARQGVLEYWLVDWPSRTLEIYRNDGAGALLHITTLGESDLLHSPLLPGFEQPIARFFIGVPPAISMNTQTGHDIPIACDLTALEPDVRVAHMKSATQLLHSDAAEITELPDGYAFRYRADQYERVVQFIANERLCCPFFTFVLEVTPAQGPLWLRITGREGVKDFLQGELGQCDCS